MKILKRFSNEIEIKLAQQFLQSHDIESQIDGAKNYETHLLGGTEGRYRLLVAEQNFAAAQKLLQEIENQPKDDEAPRRPNYFRKAVVFAIAAMTIAPVVFNVVSLLQAREFWRHSPKDSKAIFLLIIIMVLQIPSAFTATMIGQGILNHLNA